MDHHCPWVGKCIGLLNHKQFILFLAYTIAALQMGHLNLKADIIVHRYENLDDLYFDMLVAMALSFIAFCMLLFHLCIVLMNFSTIELNTLWKNNIFRDQTLMHKWCLVFGDNPKFWLLPLCCETTDPVNGLDFKANIPVSGAEPLLNDS